MDTRKTAQAEYYSRTGSTYEEAHLAPGDGHFVALEYAAGLCHTLRAGSLLDVGSGTGRAVQFLHDRHPGLRLVGLEPVAELRNQAIERGVGKFVSGDGERLPFKDQSFDVVLATALMHHVPDPDLVITEMTRVARHAIMISDANRYGQSGAIGGLAKIGLRATKLWRLYVAAKTRGRGYFVSEGDGIFFSYSIFDSIPQLLHWTPQVFVIPTSGGRPHRWTGGLLAATQGLLIAVREPPFPGWAMMHRKAESKLSVL